jgi:hypothetical protein
VAPLAVGVWGKGMSRGSSMGSGRLARTRSEGEFSKVWKPTTRMFGAPE